MTASDLRSIDRFGDLDDSILSDLAQAGRMKAYAKGEPIFYEGDACTDLYLVARGRLKIAKSLESGKELILDVLGPGDAAGEVALIDHQEFPASASALEECTLFILPRAGYLSLLEKHPQLAQAIIRDLAMRLRNMSRRMKDVSGGNVEYRIAHLLLTLGERVGSNGDTGLHINLELTRQQVADLVGTSVETAIRVMSKWRKEKIVETLPDGFVILDIERLRGIGAASL